jgi:DNA replication protein DnaC
MSDTPASTVDTARLPVLLSQLRLPTVALLWPALTETADRESWPAAKTLAALMEHEVAERARRRTARHLLEARLPVGKTLDRFDFAAVSSVSKARITALAEGDSWLDQGTNILLFGPPGTGKSHLAAALGHAMIDVGYRVLFTRTTDLVQQLQTARQELKLASAIEKLDKYHLLVLDDLSYVRKSQAETSVIFELISARYERRSLLITANQPFGAWDSIFPDPAMTVAAIDRLVHHSIILEMNTESYRRKSAETKLRRKPTGSAEKATLAETSPRAGFRNVTNWS